MKFLELIVPCHFGLEAVLKREILDLGYEISKVEDGRVTFLGDADAVARANIWLRSAERVLIKVGEFEATTFDELFEGTKALPWEEYIPKDGRFWVTKAASVKSKLFSPSDIQSIMKKAMVSRLGRVYDVSWFEESGEDYPVRVFLYKDVVTIGLDTTGESLHKRGYRKLTAKAPIAENMAAALIGLTPWRKDRILVDPFCGSGTFPIEAALMAANMAPGMRREFRAMKWGHIVSGKIWKDNIEEAKEAVEMPSETDIQGYDIDPQMVEIARANAKMAGVDHLIHFQTRSVEQLAHRKKYGFLITNPPYGERLGDEREIERLYAILGERYRTLDSWSMYVITSYEKAQQAIGAKADKNRKLYNGMLKTYFYQYMGPKPPKRNTSDQREDK
ncbi:MAG: class I SAM-dependent RNA methyltransferase [Lachnospiraceae bacterium]|nr:class I SAM-dependent RNA methyltransferase [Lachnospiraceae bacterium]